MRAITVAALALGLSSAGCGKSDEATGSHSDAGAAAGGAGGSGGASGATGSGGVIVGPAISSAPPAWARPADCGGVGDQCVGLGCGTKSTCQAIGDVCIPSVAPGMLLPGKSAERPYCLAYTCMTFDEASCFCTGDAGKQTPVCASGPAGVAGLCGAEGASCIKDPCCDGLTCMHDSPTCAACRKACATNADCDTGCCTDVKDTGQLSCAPKSACDNPCTKRGGPCPDPNVDPCCNGACVNSTNPEHSGCRPFCNTNADCDTGCCVPFTSASGGFCADAKYCTCPPEGAACGENLPACCDGMTCASRSGASTFACRTNCKSAAECPSGCCTAPFPGEDHGVCEDASACQAAP